MQTRARKPLSLVPSNLEKSKKNSAGKNKKTLGKVTSKVKNVKKKFILPDDVIVQKAASPVLKPESVTRNEFTLDFEDLKSYRFSLGESRLDFEKEESEELSEKGVKSPLESARKTLFFQSIPISPIQTQNDLFDDMSFSEETGHVVENVKELFQDPFQSSMSSVNNADQIASERSIMDLSQNEKEVFVEDKDKSITKEASVKDKDPFGLISNYKKMLHKPLSLKNGSFASGLLKESLPVIESKADNEDYELFEDSDSLGDASSLDSFDFLLAPGQIEEVNPTTPVTFAALKKPTALKRKSTRKQK